MARPLFSGSMWSTWSLRACKVGPSLTPAASSSAGPPGRASGQLSRTETSACVAQLFGTIWWAKKMELTLSESLTKRASSSFQAFLRALLSSIHLKRKMKPRTLWSPGPDTSLSPPRSYTSSTCAPCTPMSSRRSEKSPGSDSSSSQPSVRWEESMMEGAGWREDPLAASLTDVEDVG